MGYGGKDTSCGMEIDKLKCPRSKTSRRFTRGNLKEQSNSFLLHPLYQKTVAAEKKALVHFMWEMEG